MNRKSVLPVIPAVDIDNSINRESGRTPCPASSFLVNCSSSLSAITVNSISSLVSGEYLLCVHLGFSGFLSTDKSK